MGCATGHGIGCGLKDPHAILGATIVQWLWDLIYYLLILFATSSTITVVKLVPWCSYNYIFVYFFHIFLLFLKISSIFFFTQLILKLDQSSIIHFTSIETHSSCISLTFLIAYCYGIFHQCLTCFYILFAIKHS